MTQPVGSPPLPPAGPPWYGSVMGTAILATLLQTLSVHLPGASTVAVVLLGVAWALLVGLTAGFSVRILADRAVLSESVRTTAAQVTWGMVSMGILAAGSATATVIPAHWPTLTGPAFAVDAVLWAVGTILGWITAVGFALRLIGRDIGAPSTTWGLAIVPPMVSATTGTALIDRIDARSGEIWLLMVTVCCFFLALVLGLLVFAVAYHHHWRVARVALAASTSVWIPLGVVGQSTAAAQAIAQRAARFVLPQDVPTVHQIANVYGFMMLALAVPLIAWAGAVTVRGFRDRMPFVPGWWAMTFPIGTVCLGSHLVSVGAGVPAFEVVAIILCLVLCGTWTLCAVASASAVVRRRSA